MKRNSDDKFGGFRGESNVLLHKGVLRTGYAYYNALRKQMEQASATRRCILVARISAPISPFHDSTAKHISAPERNLRHGSGAVNTRRQ